MCITECVTHWLDFRDANYSYHIFFGTVRVYGKIPECVSLLNTHEKINNVAELHKIFHKIPASINQNFKFLHGLAPVIPELWRFQ